MSAFCYLPHLLATCVFISSCCVNLTISTRTRVGPNEQEPKVARLYNAQRMIFADPNHYYLGDANALKSEDVSNYLLNFQYDPQKQIQKASGFSKFNFKFNSNDYILNSLLMNWYVTLQEKTSLHVYDDPKDVELSRGPQVDQKVCGLHLDYMLHMIRKHQRHLTDSTDYSIFQIMNTFDHPRQGAALGNLIFAGDYNSCLNTPLNVIEKELSQVDRKRSREFFKSRRNLPAKELGKVESILRNYVAPFFGFHSRNRISFKSMAGTGDKLRQVPMRYCMAGLRYPKWGNSTWARRHLAFRVASCLPESCDSSSLSLYRDKIQQLTEFQMNKYYLGYHIENLYCLPDESSPFRNPWRYLNSRLFIAFNVIWFSLLVGSTLAWSLSTPEFRNQNGQSAGSGSWCWMYFNSWNVINNYSEFMRLKSKRKQQEVEKEPSSSSSTNNQVKRVNMRPLEGLRFMSSLTVIASHSMMVILVNSWNLIDCHRMISESWLVVVATVYPSTVNIFFAITGIIVSRSLLQLARGQDGRPLYSPAFWLKFFIYRYIRIVPLYLFVHWFFQSAFRFLGSGPLWDYGTSHSAWLNGCLKDSLWNVILPRANYYKPSVHCNGVGWYLANDLHFVLLTPIFLVPLWRRPAVGQAFCLLSVLLGTANHVRYYWQTDPDPRGLLEWSSTIVTRVTDETMAGYVEPKFRFVAYVLGLLAGHLLDQYEQDGSKQWPRWALFSSKLTLYLITYIILALPFLSSLVIDMDEPFLRITAALAQGCTHLLSSLATVIFVVLVTTGHFTSLGAILGSRIFKPLAAMSLSTVLVHLPVLYYHSLSLKSLPYLTAYELFKTIIFWILESLFWSVVVHILYELPMRRFLVKLMLDIFASGQPDHQNKQQAAGPNVVGNEKIEKKPATIGHESTTSTKPKEKMT